jgi:uncharacterized membrane protein
MRVSGLVLHHAIDWPRLRLGGLLTFVVGVALLAGAIHICAILLVPVLAKSDGWSRLVPYAGDDAFAEIPEAGMSGEGGVAGLDPLFVNAACHIDLADAPASITVDASDRFWSVALYDPKGVIVFSLNDRTAVEGSLDMIVVNAEQNERLKKSPTVEIETTIVTESPSDDLIALLRLFAPTRTAREDARRILASAECLPETTILLRTTSGG